MSEEGSAASSCTEVTQPSTCSWDRWGEPSFQRTKYQVVKMPEVAKNTCFAGEQNSSDEASEGQSFKTLCSHDLSTTSLVYVAMVSQRLHLKSDAHCTGGW